MAKILFCFLISTLLLASGCMRHRIGAAEPFGRKKSSYAKVSPAKMAPYIRTVFRISAENRWKGSEQDGKAVEGLGEQAFDLEAAKNLAQDLEKKGAYLKALRIYEELLFRSPQDPAWDLALARIWIALGNKPQALSHARQAFAKDGGTFESLRALGSAYLLQGRPKTAVVLLHQALQLSPQDASVLRDLATAHIQLEEWQRARALLEKVLLSNAALSSERLRLASVQVHLQETELALQELLQVHQTADAHLALGTICLQQNQWLLARRAFRQALDLKPGFQQAQEGLAEAESYLPLPTIVTLPERPSTAAAGRRAGIPVRSDRLSLQGEQPLASPGSLKDRKGRMEGQPKTGPIGSEGDPKHLDSSSAAPAQSPKTHLSRVEKGRSGPNQPPSKHTSSPVLKAAQASDWERGELTTLSIGIGKFSNMMTFIEE